MAKPLGSSVVVEGPKVKHKERQFTIGVRRRIPSSAIAAAVPRMLKQTMNYLQAEGLRSRGAPFFRFYWISMGVAYDIEVGYFCSRLLPSRGEFVAGTLPAGSYVTLKYMGKNRGYQGNKALLEWARANNHRPDKRRINSGDAFACRYEVYVTDIDTEKDSRKWVREVAIKIK
jgi:hypothetical protein